jgi:hypothetical protein
MKTADLPLRNSIQCLFALVPLLLATFWLSARIQAVTPTPDGAYTGANTAEGGSGALFRLTTGTNNTALGSQALNGVTTGSQNTATGAQALKNNTANGNTADGFQALVKNTTGSDNTATGWRALFANTNGSFNTANGFSALYANTGSHNTAVGSGALVINRTGESNTATGDGALSENLDGSNNTANGFNALGHGPSGSECGACNNNTAVGANALLNVTGNIQNNTAVGARALPLFLGGQNNIAIGYMAGANLGVGDNNIDIGNPGDAVSGDENTIRIGDVQTRAFIAGIYATTTGSSTTLPVIVDSNGQLGTAVSSERFKKDIKPMQEASESILALKPVSFHYKSDNTNTPQFGLVAEEVASVNPDLVVRDSNGKPYTVRYEAVNAMLLNEFLKEHSTVEKLQSMVAELSRRLEEQDSRMQKMSDQLGTSKTAPHRVANR